LEQTWNYLDRCGAEEGHLVIFDRTPGKPWEEKLFQRQESSHGHLIQVWGCERCEKQALSKEKH